MNEKPFRIAPLSAGHERTGFNCESPSLDRYLDHQVMQDVRRRVTACFVALTSADRIAGYYTLASASVLLTDLPAAIEKKLPRYLSVPVVRMGRLAVDRSFQGQGLGGTLLADALSRVHHSEIAAYALVVDTKDDPAVTFYLHHGFIVLPNTPMTLFLPIATINLLER